MKRKIRMVVALMLCICLMGATVVHADSDGASKTIYPAEYGMMMTFASRSTILYGSVSIEKNSDGAELLVTLSAYEWYDEEDNIFLAFRQNGDSSGSATRVDTYTSDSRAVAYSNYVLVSGTVRGGTGGNDYTDYLHWWIDESN